MNNFKTILGQNTAVKSIKSLITMLQNIIKSAQELMMQALNKDSQIPLP